MPCSPSWYCAWSAVVPLAPVNTPEIAWRVTSAMFGKNPTRKRDHGDGHSLALQGSPWKTLQGEGPYAGLPATFIRLWGCHLQCYFCDTDFESDEIRWSIDRLREACAGVELVVLTGGEPMRQNIAELCRVLYSAKHKVQVETAGSFWIPSEWFTKMPDFVVSPKTPQINYHIAQSAIAWKYIVSAGSLLDPADGLPITNTQVKGSEIVHKLARPPNKVPPSHVWVQPMDEYDPGLNKANQERCVALAYEYGYRVSLQQHKILGVL
jgi:7-carboxy-7-deazaguanine synthase